MRGLILSIGWFVCFSLNAQDSVKVYKNSIEIGGRYEAFWGNYNPRSYLYFQYGRKMGLVDAQFKGARYTLGSRSGWFFENNYYISFKKGYLHAGGTYSDSYLLPHYRYRVELYKNFNRVEVSLGGGAVKPHTYRTIPYFTGTLGYYAGNYFLYFRPTFSHVDGYSKSYFLQVRRYFDDIHYVSLSGLKGEDTGANRAFNAVENSFGNDTYLIRLQTRIKSGHYFVGVGMDFGGLYIPQRSEYAKFVGIDLFINREL